MLNPSGEIILRRVQYVAFVEVESRIEKHAPVAVLGEQETTATEL